MKKRRTAKQIAAQRRNHYILRLRGAYALFEELSEQAAMNLVDKILLDLGAETETTRRKKAKK